MALPRSMPARLQLSSDALHNRNGSFVFVIYSLLAAISTGGGGSSSGDGRQRNTQQKGAQYCARRLLRIFK